MRTCLYGDSYVDPYVIHKETTSWPTLLSQDFDIENYGLRGTGPDYSLDLLRKNGGDLIIFFVSFGFRYQWFELDHPGQSVDVADVLYWKNYSKHRIFEERFRQFLKRNSEHIKYAYKTFQVEHRTEEVLGYLRNYADINQVRLIAVIQENPFVKVGPALTIPKNVRTSLNNKYFSLYPYNLSQVSKREFVDLDKIENYQVFTDRRQNHLTNPNHVVLYKNILAMIERSELEEHLFHHTSVDEWTGDNTGFIYDE